MSELKVHKAYNRWIDEEMPTPNDDLICNEVYLKSEADKVIAELKADYEEACGRLQTANLIKDEQIVATRHSKYKRCLAMAKLCKRKRIDAADYRIPRKKWEFYDKWYKRWFKIAEQFKDKEAK